MAKTYEQKLAERRVKADAKKAEKMWHELHTVGINRIIEGMGYRETGNSLYVYKKSFYPGMQSFDLTLDVHDLLIGGDMNAKIKATAELRG